MFISISMFYIQYFCTSCNPKPHYNSIPTCKSPHQQPLARVIMTRYLFMKGIHVNMHLSLHDSIPHHALNSFAISIATTYHTIH